MQFVTECPTATFTEDGVPLAALAREAAHVLDDAQDADIGFASEVGGARGDVLGGDRRCRDDELTHLWQETRQGHRDVAGARRRVNQADSRCPTSRRLR